MLKFVFQSWNKYEAQILFHHEQLPRLLLASGGFLVLILLLVDTQKTLWRSPQKNDKYTWLRNFLRIWMKNWMFPLLKNFLSFDAKNTPNFKPRKNIGTFFWCNQHELHQTFLKVLLILSSKLQSSLIQKWWKNINICWFVQSLFKMKNNMGYSTRNLPSFFPSVDLMKSHKTWDVRKVPFFLKKKRYFFDLKF